MDGLPLELYECIFGYLDIKDLFTIRLLNKKFKYIVSQCRIHELAVFNPETVHRSYQYREDLEFVSYKSNWFSSNRPKDFLRLVDRSKLFLLKNPVESPLFTLKFLKRLKVDYFKGDHSFRLKDVNQFAGLEELEITIDGRSDEDKLTLPKLRILQISLRGSYRNEFSVSIEAAKLEAVCFARSDYHFTSPEYFQFTHPLTISHLKTGAFHKSILAFSNLQHLEIGVQYYRIDAGVLSHFVGLKELTMLGFNQRHPILAMRPAGARDLKINHEVPAWSKKDVKAFYSDYSQISYDQLLRSASQISADFFVRFNGIQLVSASSKVQNPNHLLEFLGNCPLLSNLLIYGRTQLNQRFFDQLPAVCSLNYLEVIGEFRLALDYSFILRMFFLRCLKTNEELSTDVICKLGVPFHLERVEFVFGEKRIPLKRSKGDSYLVQNYLELGLSDRSKTVKPERLAKHLSSLRSQSAGNDGRKRQRTH